MELVFREDQYVLVSSLPYIWGKPRAGDVVVAKHPSEWLEVIKRIRKIKKGKYYLEGDNSTQSIDSRHFGPVERNHILAKVIFV